MTIMMMKPSDSNSSEHPPPPPRKKGLINTLKVVAGRSSGKSRRKRRQRSDSSTTGNMMMEEQGCDGSFRSSNSNGSESFSRSSTRSSVLSPEDDSSTSKRSSSACSSSAASASSSKNSNSDHNNETRSRASTGSSRNSKKSIIKRTAEAGSCSSASSSSNIPKKKKNVQFHEIHIRDYERIVSDNPSCSSGPPIGIGWSYGNPRTVTVNHYEREKLQKQHPSISNNYPFGWHRRLLQQAMVLSRLEREQILQEWNIPHSDIIKAIRSNVKSKFDRRQTVRNTNKHVEKLELLFEGASKTFKRKLRLRKHTSQELKVLQEKAKQVATPCSSSMNNKKVDDDDAVLAATAKTESTRFSSNTTTITATADISSSAASPTTDNSNSTSTTTSRNSGGGEEVVSFDEPDDDDSKNAYDWKDMNVVVSDLCHSYPVESMVYANGESPTLGNDVDDYDYDDAATAISGITFQSVDEMELFHRELEMEMFGYEQYHTNSSNTPPTPPPPQPIGQTLAVPSTSSQRSSSSSKPSDTDHDAVPNTTFDDAADTYDTNSEISRHNNIMGIRSNNASTVHYGGAACKDEFLFYDQRQQRHSSPEYYHLCHLQQHQLLAAHASSSPNVAVYDNQASGLFRGYSLHDAYPPSVDGGSGKGSLEQQYLQPQLQQPPRICHSNAMASSGRRDPVESRCVPTNEYEYPSLNLIGDNDMMPLAYWRQHLLEEEEVLGSSSPLPLPLSEEEKLHLHHVEQQQLDDSDGVHDNDGPTIKHLPFPVTEAAATTHVVCHSNPVTILEET